MITLITCTERITDYVRFVLLVSVTLSHYGIIMDFYDIIEMTAKMMIVMTMTTLMIIIMVLIMIRLTMLVMI